MHNIGKPDFFGRFARWVSEKSGSPLAFVMALVTILAWIVTGPIFHYSDTWQLVINTGTTIVTFLMVFIIQNSQNKDTTAIQLKLDELIRSTAKAHNALMDIEQLSSQELTQIRTHYVDLAEDARTHLRKGKHYENEPSFDILKIQATEKKKPKSRKNKRKKSRR